MSKGSSRRPMAISRDTFDKNWPFKKPTQYVDEDTCMVCPHPKDAHDSDGSCMAIINLGRYLLTEDKYCECQGYTRL
jgi:hypothetical protein